MSANFDDLIKFQDKLNEFNAETLTVLLIKEITARLLSKVINRTPVKTGVLRRGWTAGKNISVDEYIAKQINIVKTGNNYTVTLSNNIEYAIYVEYGHRTPNRKGWVEGRFMLTISENEVKGILPSLIEKRITEALRNLL